MTTRQILRALRERNPERLYRSKRDRDDGRLMIASRPDTSRVPYDRLHDYWHFESWADTAESDLHLND